MKDRLDCVLFDLDNTLIPFMRPLKAWAHAWAQKAAPDDAETVADELIHATLDDGEDPERGIQRMAQRLDLNGATQDATEHAWDAYEDAIAPYPGVCGLLATLKREGLALGIVTDAPRERAWHRLTSTQLAHAFQVIVTRDDTPDGKQGPEPYQQALSVLDASPRSATMIGDWPKYDVRWPRRLGMQAILARWGYDPHDPRSDGEAPACPVATAPSEIPDMLPGSRRRGRVHPARPHQASLSAF